MSGKVGQLIESTDVEMVLPVATSQEKRMRFGWEKLPSKDFLMTWNQAMEPNSMFVEELDEQGITVTVRWALMKETPEQIRDRLNRWLENVELAFAAEALSLREWLPILDAGLAGLTVGVIPPALDQVLIGAIDRSRSCPRIGKRAAISHISSTVFGAIAVSLTLGAVQFASGSTALPKRRS